MSDCQHGYVAAGGTADCPVCTVDLERWDAVVADAIEAEMCLAGVRVLNPVALRRVAERAALRARRDLEAVEAGLREIREAADACPHGSQAPQA